MNKTSKKESENKLKKSSYKGYKMTKDDLLFIILILITLMAGIVISFQSKRYVETLKKQYSNYNYPTLLEMTYKTVILTIIILIPKVLLEKAIFPLTEKVLIDKYDKKEYKHEKTKARRKMSIYFIKFCHYLILTIHSYFVYDKLEFFPKELLGHGDMNKLYHKGLKSFSFYERPNLYDFHYLLNLAYTFADLICVVFIYDGQTDILVMIFHHFCTISLIVFSYYNHHDGIGGIIMFLHNASDIVVYLGRTMLYVVAPQIIKHGITISLLLIFIYCRLYVYGKLIIGFFSYSNWESFGINNAFKFLLVCLYILHCTWTFKLMQIMYTAITKGSFNDSRKFIKDSNKKD
jgi:hypothetical protein